MKCNFIYITAKNRSEAKRIGETLVRERLSACVNIISGMNSIYRWEGEICRGSEAALIAKTRSALVPGLIKRVKALHSYSCPCIVSLPITGGNKDFLKWIHTETRS